jgi:hypothetical protein
MHLSHQRYHTSCTESPFQGILYNFWYNSKLDIKEVDIILALPIIVRNVYQKLPH